MHIQIAPATLIDEQDDLDDDSIGASITIDYERDLAMTEPDQPGGRIVFSSADYATDEEADAAFEAFVEKAIGEAHEAEA